MFELENEPEELLKKIEDLIQRKQYTQLRDLLLPMEAQDISRLCEDMDEKTLPLVFRLLPKEQAAEVFVELDSDQQEMLIQGFSNTELKEVLDELYLDDTVDIVEEMPANVVKRILRHSDPEMRKSINEILKYPEDCAGSIMTTEFVDLKATLTVADALKRIRRTGPDKETINICYVTDAARPSAPFCWRRRTTSSAISWIPTSSPPTLWTTRRTWPRPSANTTSWHCRWWTRRTAWWASSP